MKQSAFKKLSAAVLAVLLTASLAACGGKSDGVRYALITGPEGTEESAALSQLQAGMEDYVSQTGSSFQTYASSTMDTSDYLNAIDEAVNASARYIVLSGAGYEQAAYEAQKKYHDTRFLLFDGEPRENEDSEPSIRKNTLCIRFSPQDEGFLAGYAIVMDDYWNLSFLAGRHTDLTEKILHGFAQGAETAAAEQGLEAGNVNMTVEFAGTDELTPLRMSDTLDLFGDGGRSMVLPVGENIITAAVMAAEADSKTVITVGGDWTGKSDQVRFSIVPDYARAVQEALSQAEDSFKGGQTVYYGMKENSLQLSGDFSSFDTFTQDMYNSILNRVASGEIEISTEMPEQKLVTITELTKDTEESAESQKN